MPIPTGTPPVVPTGAPKTVKVSTMPKWVKLYLVPQTDNANTMPAFVVGLLTGDTPAHYVLNPMLDGQLDEASGMHTLEPVGMNFINRVYVWRCQILESKPDEQFMEDSENMMEDMSGGLG